MIDLHVPAGLLPDGAAPALLDAAARALLRWEGVPATPPYTDNTGTYLHELPPAAVRTAAGPDPRTVRIQVLTPPGALDRDAQRGLVAELTGLVAEATGDPGQAARTWVQLLEAAEGGWGIAGTALGRAEFAALAAGTRS